MDISREEVRSYFVQPVEKSQNEIEPHSNIIECLLKALDLRADISDSVERGEQIWQIKGEVINTLLKFSVKHYPSWR